MRNISKDPRVFEVLAATTRRTPTAGPGNRSFSKALIDSLKEQLDKHEQVPFTTAELNADIMRRRNNQNSHVFRPLSRYSPRSIKLAPLYVEEGTKSPVPPLVPSYVTIRLAINNDGSLDVDQIETLGKELSQACHKADVGVRAMEWLEYKPGEDGNRIKENERTRSVIRLVQDRWRFYVHRKNKQEHNTEAHEVFPAVEDLSSSSSFGPGPGKTSLSLLTQPLAPITPPLSVNGEPDSPTIDIAG